MKGKKLLSLTMLLVLILALALSSCGQQAAQGAPAQETPVAEKETPAEPKEVETPAETGEEVSLKDWEGVWNNYATYFDDKELEPTIEKVAKAQNTTPEEFKNKMQSGMAADFKGMEIKGNTIHYLDNFKSRGGKAVEQTEYEFKGKHKGMHGNHEFFWYEFQAKGQSKYPVLLMLEVHGEENLAHYHMRYGKSAEELLSKEKESWYPTFVKETTTHQQIIDALDKQSKAKDHDHDHDHDHDKEASSLEDWAGTWNNMGAYLDDEGVQAGFEALAKKENKSVEEVKAAYKEKRKCDFDGLVIDKDHVTFLDGFKDKDGKEIEKVHYHYTESHKVKHGNHELTWAVFKAEGDAKYPYLLLMGVHGEESLTHFHMRYGDDVQKLLAVEGWYPTFVKPNSTQQQIVDEIAE